MTKICHAYLTCALWSSSTGENGETPLDELSEEVVEKAEKDCRYFLHANGDKMPSYNDPRYSDAEKCGQDLWLTRNGHGAGFWDREELGKEEGERLTKIAHDMGEIDLYEGDDGKLYFSIQ